MTTLLPWLHNSWRHLCDYKSQNRIPQALLITGNKGVGKHQLVDQFAFSLLCTASESNGFCCGHCHSCLLIQAGTHPDLVRIEPAEPGKAIGIDSIRTVIADMQLKPQYDAYRVIIIEPAEQMNRSAANAFLKCLEEPGERTIIILISDKPASIPATITSRCQKLAVDIPAAETFRAWLRQQQIDNNLDIITGMTRNSPLLARQYADDQTLSLRNDCFKDWLAIAKRQSHPVMVAEKWIKLPQSELLFWLSSWMTDLIKCFYQTRPDNFYNPDLISLLQELTGQLDLKGLYKLYDLILVSRQRLETQINKQLMFEEILIHWSNLNRSK